MLWAEFFDFGVFRILFCNLGFIMEVVFFGNVYMVDVSGFGSVFVFDLCFSF